MLYGIGKPATRTEDVAYYDEDGGWTFGTLTPRMSQETHRDDEPDVYRFGKKVAGATLDGRLPQGQPTVVRRHLVMDVDGQAVLPQQFDRTR